MARNSGPPGSLSSDSQTQKLPTKNGRPSDLPEILPPTLPTSAPNGAFVSKQFAVLVAAYGSPSADDERFFDGFQEFGPDPVAAVGSGLLTSTENRRRVGVSIYSETNVHNPRSGRAFNCPLTNLLSSGRQLTALIGIPFLRDLRA
jgi:hypothetical protein